MTDRSESPLRLLVVATDTGTLESFRQALAAEGVEVSAAASDTEALAALEARGFDLVACEVRAGGAADLEQVARLAAAWPELPIIVVASEATVDTAVQALRSGAADFVSKPLEGDEIRYVVKKAARLSERSRERAPDPPAAEQNLLGESDKIKEIYRTIDRAAPSASTVLVRGESGTGKELVARLVHERSRRATGPFVAVHCAALPDNLLESELFGYEKGAFTGATGRKPGRVELAEGGTLFLDEIGDITPAIQVKLLRLLQEKAYDRLGGTKTVKADVRFVAATHRNLEAMVKAGTFREDLFYRLNVVPIWLPALRERAEDIERLVRHFVAEVGAANERPELSIDADAVELLRNRKWRGNVRELHNFVERLVVLSDGARLTAKDVQRELGKQPGMSTVIPTAALGGTLDSRIKAAERDAILAALKNANGNRSAAARLLGISRRTLYTKLEEHALL